MSRCIPTRVSTPKWFLKLIANGFSLDKQDTTILWNNLRERISLVKGGKIGAGQGSFGHLTGGYDAGYYGCV
jgi:Zn-dependent oligopeptidase